MNKRLRVVGAAAGGEGGQTTAPPAFAAQKTWWSNRAWTCRLIVAFKAAAILGRTARLGDGAMWRSMVYACFVLSAGPTWADVPSVADLFQQFGLVGTWAVDCKAAPSPSNPHVTDVLQNGAILERQDLGPDTEANYYRVVAATRVSATRLSVQAIFRPGGEGEERQELVWSVHNGTRRTLRNQPAGEPLRVKNGIAVGFGVRTPVLRKCSSDPLSEKVRAE